MSSLFICLSGSRNKLCTLRSCAGVAAHSQLVSQSAAGCSSSSHLLDCAVHQLGSAELGLWNTACPFLLEAWQSLVYSSCRWASEEVRGSEEGFAFRCHQLVSRNLQQSAPNILPSSDVSQQGSQGRLKQGFPAVDRATS